MCPTGTYHRAGCVFVFVHTSRVCHVSMFPSYSTCVAPLWKTPTEV